MKNRRKLSFYEEMKNLERYSELSHNQNYPLIVKIGVANSKIFTDHFEVPFDEKLQKMLLKTVRRVCEDISYSCMAYVTRKKSFIVVREAYEGKENFRGVSKDLFKFISMVSAKMSLYFRKELEENGIEGVPDVVFTATSFTLSRNKISKYLRWAQNETIRDSLRTAARYLAFDKNSKSKLSRDNFKNREILEKNSDVVFDDLEEWKKWGSIIYEEVEIKEEENDKGIIEEYEYYEWVTNFNAPLFKEVPDLFKKLFTS